MRKIICLLVLLLSSGVFAANAWAEIKKADFITLTFPRGITLDVPGNALDAPRQWIIASADYPEKVMFDKLVRIKKNAVLSAEDHIVTFAENENYIALARCNPNYIIGLGISSFIPDPSDYIFTSQEEVEKITARELKVLSDKWRDGMQKFLNQYDQTLCDWSDLSKVKTNNLISIRLNFKIKFPGTAMIMEKEDYVFLLNEDSFSIAVWSINTGSILQAAPDILKILNSVRIEK